LWLLRGGWDGVSGDPTGREENYGIGFRGMHPRLRSGRPAGTLSESVLSIFIVFSVSYWEMVWKVAVIWMELVLSGLAMRLIWVWLGVGSS
jgi:hypothetical protein